MIEKPEIQYVGQFYVHGSEARKLELQRKQEERKAKTRLPLERLRQIEKIYLDPVAILAMAAAVVLLVAMIMGVAQLKSDWAVYRAEYQRVADLNRRNAQLHQELRESYDLEDIRIKALALGLVPVDQIEVKTVAVTMPEIPEEPAWAEVKAQQAEAFWKGLWEE